MGDCGKAHTLRWLPTEGRIPSYSFAELCQLCNLQDKLYPKAMHAWKTQVSLVPVGIVPIPKSANRICQFVMVSTTSCFQAWLKQ